MLKTLCIWLHLCTTISGQATVIDGDSIAVDGYHIRIQGLDAEELHEPHGRMARDGMSLLVRGHIVVCTLSGSRSYNRYVGSCSVNHKDIARA